MPEILPRIKGEKLAGLLFVLLMHGMALYGLWSYRIIPTPDEAITLMVNLINPPSPEQPKPPQPEPPKPPKLRTIEPPPPEHQHLVVEAPVVLPDEPVAYAPPPSPSPSPAVEVPQSVPTVVEAPSLPPQSVMLPGELSVSCPERSPPDYPMFAKRMNEQGKVVLRVELGEDGRVVNATVKTSSGHQRLDNAALSAVKMWRCKPVIRNGVAVSAVALQPFSFILEER